MEDMENFFFFFFQFLVFVLMNAVSTLGNYSWQDSEIVVQRMIILILDTILNKWDYFYNGNREMLYVLVLLESEPMICGFHNRTHRTPTTTMRSVYALTPILASVVSIHKVNIFMYRFGNSLLGRVMVQSNGMVNYGAFGK